MNLTHVFADVASRSLVLALLAAVVLVQTTFVLGIGLAVTGVLRRRGAAVESACQRIVLSAALLTPLASALIGLAVARVRIPLPALETAAPQATAENRLHRPLAQTTAQPPGEDLMSAADRAERPPLFRKDTPRLPSDATRPIGRRATATDLASARPAATGEFWLRAAARACCASWFCIAAILVFRLAGSLVGASRLISAAVGAEPELIERCRELAAHIGVRFPRVKRSPFVPGPCVFGWRRPAILLPESDAEVDDDVLIHELAHIARRDCFWKTLSETAAALLWFQPLLWRLKSRMQFCAEDVCDDFVVQFGTDRCAYADRLTRIAEELAARGSQLRIQQVGIGIVSFRSSLGRRVSRILDSRRRLAIRAGRKTIAGLVCGAAAIVFAVGLFEIDREPARATAADEPAKTTTKTEPTAAPRRDLPRTPGGTAKIKLLPANEASDDVVKVRGTIRRPDGSPAAGARISVVHSAFFNRVGSWRQIAAVVAAQNGTFEVVYRKSQFGKHPKEADEWNELTIVVEADGFASNSNDVMKIDASKPLVVRLAPEFPIRGRLIDLQGRPVAGVPVNVTEIDEWVQGSLDSWLEQVNAARTRWTPAYGMTRTTTVPRNQANAWVVTDHDGRFEIHGIAGERRVALALRGESITYERLRVVTRHMPTVKPSPAASEFPIDPVYGAEFTCITYPGRPIEGTVRDATTGKPLPGVRVQVYRFANSEIGGKSEPNVLTDEKGRYRLAGLPLGKGNALFLTPSDELPYLMREVQVPEWRASGSNVFDVGLHRGIWITGRATDKVTGEPVVARVYYFPFLNNPFAEKLPEYHDGNVDGDQNRYWTRPDGSFRVVGLPGRAILGAESSGARRYRAGVGASAICGMDKYGRFLAYRNPIDAGQKWPDVVKEINPAQGVAEVKCDMLFDAGKTIHVSVVDPKGQAVEGAMVQGASAAEALHPKPARFDMVGFVAGDKRPVLIYHEKRRIGKFFLLDYNDKTPDSMTIVLEPCAIVKGRVVDRDGVGVKANVCGAPRPGGDFWPRTEPVDSQPDGKFECAVPDGCPYALSVDAPRLGRAWLQDVLVAAGKTIDVGDVKIGRRK